MRIGETINGVLVYREITEEEITEQNFHAPAISYETLVEQFIRERYTVSDELALLRQRDIKKDEFAEYNVYCEECKARARSML